MRGKTEERKKGKKIYKRKKNEKGKLDVKDRYQERKQKPTESRGSTHKPITTKAHIWFNKQTNYTYTKEERKADRWK